MKKLSVIVIFVLLSSGLFFIGCSKPKTNVEEGNEKGILLLGNGQEPQGLDPHIATGVSEQRIISALLEGLVTENPKTLAAEPGVAKKWNVSDNGLIYTFYLRNNAKWSNGDSVTAYDFVYSYKRVLSPKLGAQNAYMLFCMKNAELYNKGKIKDFSKVGVKALNRYTLQITLIKPVPYFLSLLTNLVWLPVNKKNVEKFGDIDERGTKWTFTGNYVSNGPFKLKDWQINNVIKIAKNDKYWDAEHVKLNQVGFLPISDNQTEERAFRGKQLHITYTIPTSKILKYEKENPELIRIVPYLGTYYYIFNVRKPPLNNSKLREALSMAIDRESLAKHVIKGGKLPAYSFVPPDTGSYTSEFMIKENIKKARILLSEAGYPDGKGLPTFEIMYNTSNRNRRLGEAIQQMWKKNLNVDVVLINREWKVYLDSFRTKNFTIAGASWIGDYNDPNTFLDLWKTDSGNNRAGWSDKKYDYYVDQASNEGNRTERNILFNEAETILLKQSPIMPIYYYTSLALVDPSVQGWYSNVLDHHPLKYVALVSTEKSKTVNQ